MAKCKDCKNYYGNCGKHFIDSDKHVCYDIASETYYDGGIGDTPSCFEPSERYLETKKEKLAKELCSSYSVDVLEKALKIASAKVGETDG